LGFITETVVDEKTGDRRTKNHLLKTKYGVPTKKTISLPTSPKKPKNMKTDGNDAYCQRTYSLSSGKRAPSGSVDGIQVVVLEDAPKVVEVWSTKFVYGEDPGAVLTMQVVDGQVVEKCISMKNRWHPETIANEVKTQGEISSKHLVLPTFTVEVIYFGNVEISETLTYRIDNGGYLPKTLRMRRSIRCRPT
jgi:hypothetical protein